MPALPEGLHHPDDGPEQHDVHAIEDREAQQHALRIGQREVAGNDLAEHHVQEGDDAEPDDDAEHS